MPLIWIERFSAAASNQPQRRACSTRDAIARCDVRVGAMIDVEERALRTFEQKIEACLLRVIEQPRNIGEHRPYTRSKREGVVTRFLKVDNRRLEIIFEHEIVIIEHVAKLRRKALRVHQVIQTYRAARNFILIRRPDAAPGRSNLSAALGCLSRMIDSNVVRQNQRAGG